MARILCVDDEPGALTLKRATLEHAGHNVEVCGSVECAQERLLRAAFDAVVTDWRLGPASGRAVLETARNHAAVPVVIVVSGFVAEAMRAAEPHADLYLEKPVHPEELVKVVNALLRSHARKNGSDA